ncbi:MAG: c-type cytochrome [Deltaproteobacteria bacterium]
MSDKDIQQPYKSEDEQTDIYDLHRQALRETPEPREGLERPPWWMWVIFICLIFWAGFYLGRYGGVFGPEVHLLSKVEKTKQKAVVSTAEIEKELPDGAEVYNRVCTACHQSNGQGVPGAFPPLVDSEWLLGDAETPIKIVLHGLQGAINVAGNTFNGVMPAWGGQLSDEEIAAVLTYARSSWGNSASEISPETVQNVRNRTSDRTTNWTAGELKR